MQATDKMEAALVAHVAKGLLVPRTENNKYLKVSYRGTGKEIPSTWNVKVYSSGAVVTTDEHMLNMLVQGSYTSPDSRLKVLQIDDAGWGFCMCGVMIGVSDSDEMMTGVVDVRWFKKGVFDTKKYLSEYSRIAREILDEHFNAKPFMHRIEICSGFINSVLKDDLRLAGFDVRVANITGFLQNRLEGAYKEYVKIATGADLAYDPKAIADKAVIARKYAATLDWGKKNCPAMLKDGWKSMGGVS